MQQPMPKLDRRGWAVRVALFQGPERSGPVEANVAAIGDAARAAADAGADLLVCPELAATGYNLGAAAVHALAEPADGPLSRRLAGVAADAGIALVYGYPERAPEGVYNATRAVDRHGERLADYRKCHLYGELDRGLFLPGGTGVVQFGLGGLTVGLLTCYDVEFPEAVRAHALAGTELLVVPTGLMEPYGVVSERMVPVRAMESQLFVAYANRCGAEGDLAYCGSSCVIAPDGSELARAGRHEQLLFADVDPAALQASRRVSTYLRDRRPELYATEPRA
jgi:predicted amidohydrolase